jgi:hypothetical protein
MERLQHPFAVVDADDRVEPLDAAHLGANLAARLRAAGRRPIHWLCFQGWSSTKPIPS